MAGHFKNDGTETHTWSLSYQSSCILFPSHGKGFKFRTKEMDPNVRTWYKGGICLGLPTILTRANSKVNLMLNHLLNKGRMAPEGRWLCL